MGLQSSAGSDEPLGWPERFSIRTGRRPRVLHIGNVGNYAFVNARLMRRFGVDADVVDPDSYHIMAYPAWYDASIEGDWGSDFAPQWSRVSLNGYVPPDWFAQGPRDLVFALLAARSRGDQVEVARLYSALAKAVRGRARLLNSRLYSTAQNAIQSTGDLGQLLRTAVRRLIYGQAIQTSPSHALSQGANEQVKLPALPELVALRDVLPILRQVMDSYDVVQGYALGAVYPLAVGHPRVVAYELGTLRGLPPEK